MIKVFLVEREMLIFVLAKRNSGSLRFPAHVKLLAIKRVAPQIMLCCAKLYLDGFDHATSMG
jgi:hypothetical protein